MFVGRWGGGWGVELGVHFGTCMLHVLTSRKPGALFTKKTASYKDSHYIPKPVIMQTVVDL